MRSSLPCVCLRTHPLIRPAGHLLPLKSGEGTVDAESLYDDFPHSHLMPKSTSHSVLVPDLRRSEPIHPSDLIAHLLDEQSEITAVEQFSAWHKSATEPAQARYYRDLLPAVPPGPGQQLAFQVDLDKCSGCKACVVACHTLNGLDDGESFRDVGLLLGAGRNGPIFQHVTTACHHCVDPGCLNACPVNAYEKDPITGIVRHLDDQCFGCQYCTLACPYEVPKYHAAKGIVRKCDMCSQRLSTGEAPACVQACPHQAISIQVIDITAARLAAQTTTFLADAPDPCITLPTTRFVGAAASNESLRSGTYVPRPLEHAHRPLILLLVLSQISVGITVLVSLMLLQNMSRFGDGTRTVLLAIASLLAVVSAVASTLHLGRPQYAFRAVIGIGHSWLSREIVAFGTYIPLSMTCAVLSYLDSPLLNPALVTAAVCGVAGVAASVMIYHVTRRPFWNAARSGLAFAAGGIGIGSLTCTTAILFEHWTAGQDAIRVLMAVAAGCLMLKLWQLRQACQWNRQESHSDRCLCETSSLLRGPLQFWKLLQVASTLMALIVTLLIMVPVQGADVARLAIFALTSAVIAEFTERFLFFRAVTSLRMPGVRKS